MARLTDLIPRGEAVHWVSASAFRPWKLTFAIAAFSAVWLITILYVGTFLEFGLLIGIIGLFGVPAVVIAVSALFPEAEVAVTDGHVVWLHPMDFLGRAPGGGKGVVALAAIGAIELEEGSDTMTIQGKDFAHRIERVAGGRLEELARVVSRAARMWRVCQSPGAMRARRWQGYANGMAMGALTFFMYFAVAYLGYLWDLPGFSELAKTVFAFVAAFVVAFAIGWFVLSAIRTLPHLLVGRRLLGEERRDFVGWMTDPRWQGVKPEGSDDESLPHSRLERWAMRVAYGEIPDIGEREPEVLIPGEFPEE